MIIDSGARREFESGAVRDIQEGKGRCDLLPLCDISELTHDEFIRAIGMYLETRDTMFLKTAIRVFVHRHYQDSWADALLELAKHFEDGAKKYSDRNWEKGIPCHCFIDSGVRHYFKFQRGDSDEPHDRAVLWNLVCLMWTLRNHPELDDLPEPPEERKP